MILPIVVTKYIATPSVYLLHGSVSSKLIHTVHRDVC